MSINNKYAAYMKISLNTNQEFCYNYRCNDDLLFDYGGIYNETYLYRKNKKRF